VDQRPARLERVLADLLSASHLLEPDDLPGEVRAAAARLGAHEARIHLVDYQQHELCELRHPREPTSEPQVVDTTLAGRVYRTSQSVALEDGDDRHVLLPLINGTHRLGVLDLRLGAADVERRWEDFAALVADLIVAKSAYGDTIHVTRRARPMAVRAEAQRSLLPPLTLTTPRVLITGMLEPSYEVAGDCFDYAVNGDVTAVAIFDAMGHSLSATLSAAVAVAAYRNTRRRGGSLLDAWESADEAVAQEFAGERFTTALFGELHLASGRLRTLSAGHPPALIVRDANVVAHSADDPTLPLGLAGAPPTVSETDLQPGDRLLLFTDGIVEARSAAGEFFGEARLVDYLIRELVSGLPPAEAVRRLIRAVTDHQAGRLADDATLLLVEWRGGAQR
jgi:hypothetical protein